MNGRGRWLFVFAGMAGLVVVLVGVILGGGSALAPAPAAPTPTPPVAVPSATATASPSPAPTTGAAALYRVYFARDQLPPVGATVPAIALASREERIVERIGALMRSGAQTPPAGSTNPAALIRQHTTIAGGFTQTVAGLAAKIDGDVATVEFDIEDWGVRGAAVTQALVQQLVYTITEEPGLRRARLVDKGKASATIDQLVVDKPLSREDVLEYGIPGSRETIDSSGTAVPSAVSVGVAIDEPAPGMARVMFELTPDTKPSEPRWVPQLTARLREPDAGSPSPEAKAVIELRIAGGRPEGTSLFRVDRSPVRSIQPSGETWSVYVEDMRPWRVSVEPGREAGQMRVVLDVGGPPPSVNANLAVYMPRAGAVSQRTVQILGTARVFEAAVSWRLKDGGAREVARGTMTASLGTSPVWGTFGTSVSVPPSVTGDVTLEVYWGSPRDGSDQDLIAIPLTIR